MTCSPTDNLKSRDEKVFTSHRNYFHLSVSPQKVKGIRRNWVRRVKIWHNLKKKLDQTLLFGISYWKKELTVWLSICRFQNNLKLIFSQGEFLEIFSGWRITFSLPHWFFPFQKPTQFYVLVRNAIDKVAINTSYVCNKHFIPFDRSSLNRQQPLFILQCNWS